MEALPSAPTPSCLFPPDRTSKYQGLTLVVPGQFHADSQTLLGNQEMAIGKGVAYPVSRVTKEHILGWVDGPKRPCIYLNLPPTKREQLPYLALSFGERDNLVVTGVFIIGAFECFRLEQSERYFGLGELSDSYTDILSRYPGVQRTALCGASRYDVEHQQVPGITHTDTTLLASSRPRPTRSDDTLLNDGFEPSRFRPNTTRLLEPGLNAGTSREEVTACVDALPLGAPFENTSALSSKSSAKEKPSTTYISIECTSKKFVLKSLDISNATHLKLLKNAKEAHRHMKEESASQCVISWDNVPNGTKYRVADWMISNAHKSLQQYYNQFVYDTPFGKRDWVSMWYLAYSHKYRTRSVTAEKASHSPHDSDFQRANSPGGVYTKQTSQEVCGSNHDAGETFHSSPDVSLVLRLPAEAQFRCLPSGTSSLPSEYHNDRTELPNDSHSCQSAPIPVIGIPFHGSRGFLFAQPDEMIVETPSFVQSHNTPPAGFTSSVLKSPTVAAYLPPTAESRAKDESSNLLEQPQERAFLQYHTSLPTTDIKSPSTERQSSFPYQYTTPQAEAPENEVFSQISVSEPSTSYSTHGIIQGSAQAQTMSHSDVMSNTWWCTSTSPMRRRSNTNVFF